MKEREKAAVITSEEIARQTQEFEAKAAKCFSATRKKSRR